MTFITNAINSALPLFHCWFGYNQQNFCTYNIYNPPIYFSLGEALAAFGLILTVYQLKTISWDIVLRIREKWQRNLFLLLGILGLLSVGIASLISQIPIYSLKPPFNYPLFYELIGFVLLILAPITFIFLGSRRNGLFNKNRSSRFYGVILREITNPKSNNIEACIDIIDDNLPEILGTIKNMRHRWPPDDTSPFSDDEMFARDAISIINVILGDKRVANYIVTSRFDFIVHLFSEIKRNNVYSQNILIGIGNIFECFFKNNESYLYTQLDFGGVSLAFDIYEFLFSGPTMINVFDPYEKGLKWYHKDEISTEQLEVFLNALKSTTEGYWKNKGSLENNRAIERGFERIIDYSKHLVFSLYSKGCSDKIIEELNKIAGFLGRDFIFIYKKALENKSVSEDDINAKIIDSYRKSLCAIYAESAYGYLEALSMLNFRELGDVKDRIRWSLLEVLEHTMGVVSRDNDEFENIRKIIMDLIWKRIEDNMKGGYASIFPVILLAIGFDVGRPSDSPVAKERDKLLSFMEAEIAPQLLKKTNKVHEKDLEDYLFSGIVIFNKKIKKFEYVMRRGDTQVMKKTGS